MTIDCRRWRAGFLALFGVLLVAACGKPTPYVPLGPNGGYAEQQLEDERFRVIFTGNELTPRTTVEDYLLLRAAEVTLAEGFNYFRVVNRDTEKIDSYFTSAGTLLNDRLRDGERSVSGSVSVLSTTTAVSRYDAIVEILLTAEKTSASDGTVYDARQLERRLRATAVIPE